MTHKLKFTLPVGAFLGGLRHLGNGEFVGYALPALPDEMRNGLARVPASVLVERKIPGAPPEFPKAVEFDDPHDRPVPIHRCRAVISWPGGVTETSYLQRHGLTSAEIAEARS
jgi:hypothetical protein